MTEKFSDIYRANRRWLVLAAFLVLAAPLALTGGPAQAQAPNAGLRDLTHISQLKEAFNRDHGIPRLILLMSPT